MKNTRAFRALAGGVLFLGGMASATAGVPPATEPKVPGYVYYADAVLLRWLSKTIREHELTDLPNSSLIFLCATSEDGTYREVEVREKGATDPLNPNAARRLFALRIDLRTGALVTDAPKFDGTAFGERKYRLLLPGVKRRSK